MDEEIAKIYGDRLRVRVCGLCWQNDKILLVNHKSLTASNLWLPPGGGVEFGESLEMALKREFREETGLEIGALKLAFVCEFIKIPLHAIEIFFSVELIGGTLKAGYDPELQIIQDVRFLSNAEIKAISRQELHGIFGEVQSTDELRNLTGFYSI